MSKILEKKKMLLLFSIGGILLIALGATLAYFAWTGDESTIAVTVSSGTGSCTLLEDNSVKLIPTDSRDKGRIVKLNARQEMSAMATITWNLNISTINSLADKTFKYEMVNSTTNESYGSGTFENVSKGQTIVLNSNELLEKGKDYEFTLYLWIDGASGDNPITMANQSFSFSINCQIMGAEATPSD